MGKSAANAPSSAMSPWLRTCRRYGMAAGFTGLGLCVLSYSVWYWLDQHQIVTVTIVAPSGATSGVYRVRKGDISDAKMVTVDGLHIRFSTAERLEILAD
ncbi:MAG: hypothetical protein ACRDBI_09435 [Shewanella sp.]